MNDSPSPLLALYRIVLVVLGLVVLSALIADPPGNFRRPSVPAEQFIRERTYGPGWPFDVPEGLLECHDGRFITVQAFPEGKFTPQTYALNEAAKRVARARGWRDSRAIQAPNGDLTPVLDFARSLCRTAR